MGARSWVYCWKWNSRSTGKNRNGTSVDRTWTSLSYLNLSCQESGQGLDEEKSHKTTGIHNCTQTGKGIYIRTLCQKIKGFVEIKQRSIKTDSKTIYRTLLSKRTPFQIVIEGWSHLWKVPRGRWIRHRYPMWLWGYSSFKILSPATALHGTMWLLWCPHKKVLHFIWNVGLIKG
jgi:hypothetical protein